MNVAVVVATYNERDNIAGLVAAILGHPGYRVIVVDDNSPDGTGAACRRARGRCSRNVCR